MFSKTSVGPPRFSAREQIAPISCVRSVSAVIRARSPLASSSAFRNSRRSLHLASLLLGGSGNDHGGRPPHFQRIFRAGAEPAPAPARERGQKSNTGAPRPATRAGGSVEQSIELPGSKWGSSSCRRRRRGDDGAAPTAETGTPAAGLAAEAAARRAVAWRTSLSRCAGTLIWTWALLSSPLLPSFCSRPRELKGPR